MGGHVWADGRKYPFPPAGFISSDDAARMIGIGPNALRAMRCDTKPGADRGPRWFTAEDGYRPCYRVQDVRAYVEAKAAKLRQRADEMLTRASGEVSP